MKPHTNPYRCGASSRLEGEIMAEHAFVDLYATSTDDVTIVEAYLSAEIGGEPFKELRSADARRNPEDDCDPVIGQLLAHGRALESLGRRLQREAWGRIKHKDDMRVQEKVKETVKWAEMKARHNMDKDIQRALIGVHHVGETKRWAINEYVQEHSGTDNLGSMWRWFVQQDPAEVSRGIWQDGVTHGVSKYRVSEAQKGVKRVLQQYGYGWGIVGTGKEAA